MRKMLAVGLLALLTTGCALNARTGLAVVVAVNDRNGDAVLDAEEVRAMVERAFPPERLTGGFWDGLRASLTAAYWARDRDGDGRLSVAELGR